MKFLKDQGDSLEPCKHMESMLNRTADGTAPKWMRWYAQSHAAQCGRCGAFLKRVTSLLQQLRGLNPAETPCSVEEKLSAERWESVEASWAEAEK